MTPPTKPSKTPPKTSAVRGGRTGKTRTRTGCFTCRRRRVKCDETRSVCLGCQRLSKRTGVEVKCEYPTFDERLWSPEQNLEQSLEPKTDLKAEPKAELMSDPPNITSKTEAKTVSKTETKPTRKVGRPRKHPIMVPETMVGTVPTENVPNASPKASEAGATATVGITDTQLEATAHSEMGGSVNSNRPIVGMDKIVPATVSIENEIATSAGLDAAFGKLHAVANEGPSTRPSATAAAKEKDSKAGLKRATIESDAAFGWPTTETENQWAGAIEMGAAFRKLHVVAKEGTSAASSAATIGVLAQGLDATLAEAARVPDTVAGATVAAEHEDTSLHGAPVNSAANFTGVTRNHEAGLNMATKAMDPRKMAAADNKIVESESKRTPETKPSENANLFLSGGVVSAENDAVAASSMAPGKSLGVIENNVDLAATDIDRQIVLKWAADAENAKAGLETPVALAPIITSAKKDNTQDKLVRSEAFINSDPKQNKTATCALSEDFTHGTIGDDQLPLLDRTTTDEVGSSLSNRSSLPTTLSTLSTYTIAQDQIYEPASASSATLTISPTITEDEANIKVLTMLPPLLHGLSEMQMVMGSSSPIVQEALSEALINHSIIGAAQRIILEKKEIKSELRNNAIQKSMAPTATMAGCNSNIVDSVIDAEAGQQCLELIDDDQETSKVTADVATQSHKRDREDEGELELGPKLGFRLGIESINEDNGIPAKKKSRIAANTIATDTTNTSV